MFVDLMNDIYNTFADRFLKVQIVFEAPAPPPPPPQAKPTKRYNALGILEDVPVEETNGSQTNGTDAVIDSGPAEEPAEKPVTARKDPVIVGAGRTRSLSGAKQPGAADWANVGRNDPCPCGSGKKYKKCHGAMG